MIIKHLLAIAALAILSFSCSNDDEASLASGTFQVYFDNKIGSSEVTMREAGDVTYDYETANGEKFNVALLGYYVSKNGFESTKGEPVHDKQSKLRPKRTEDVS